jgi:hypothetical protein
MHFYGGALKTARIELGDNGREVSEVVANGEESLGGSRYLDVLQLSALKIRPQASYVISFPYIPHSV